MFPSFIVVRARTIIQVARWGPRLFSPKVSALLGALLLDVHHFSFYDSDWLKRRASIIRRVRSSFSAAALSCGWPSRSLLLYTATPRLPMTQ